MTYDKELAAAKQIALKAGVIMWQYFDDGQDEETKEDGTPVTIADKSVNRMVIEELTKAFPDDGIVGEEESTAEYGAGRRWICDPIDGTAAYTYGVATAMFSLGLVLDGVPTVGVAYDPFLKRMYWAVRGHGSHCNNSLLHVSALDLGQGIVAMPPTMNRIYDHEPDITKLLAYKPKLAVFDGAVMRGCLVARGKLVGFPHPSVKPHDIAAVHVLIEEAGGKVTGLKGETLDYSRPFTGAVLSNGVVHAQLVNLFS